MKKEKKINRKGKEDDAEETENNEKNAAGRESEGQLYKVENNLFSLLPRLQFYVDGTVLFIVTWA
jgi:hypothetical protein